MTQDTVFLLAERVPHMMCISQDIFLCRDYVRIITGQRQDNLQCRNKRKDGAVQETLMFYPRRGNMDLNFLSDFPHFIQFHFQRGSDQFVSISVSWAQKLSHKRCCSPTSCSCLLQCGSCFTVACVMPELIQNVASLMLLRGSFMHLNMTRTEATQLPLCSCGRWFC